MRACFTDHTRHGTVTEKEYLLLLQKVEHLTDILDLVDSESATTCQRQACKVQNNKDATEFRFHGTKDVKTHQRDQSSPRTASPATGSEGDRRLGRCTDRSRAAPPTKSRAQHGGRSYQFYKPEMAIKGTLNEHLVQVRVHPFCKGFLLRRFSFILKLFDAHGLEATV